MENDSREQELQRALADARHELDVQRRRLAAQRARAGRQQRRAEEFRSALKEIQRSVFRGDIHELVLLSCVRLTDATRGLYLAREGGELRVRAHLGFEGYAGADHPPPSPFMRALATRVLELDDVVVLGDADTTGLPPTEANEHVRTCAAIPVAVFGDRRGVLVVADKPHGQFDEDDLETLLHVGDQAAVAMENARLRAELEDAYTGTVGLLADAVEAKDSYTRGHCQRVSQLSRLTAERMGLDQATREVVCLAALLHDVGKIGVSDGILNKPGPLMPAERELLRSHVRIGHDLLRSLPALQAVSDVVLHHHESFDGTGYPDALAGEQIPIGSRIVAAVDAYCAMIDQRSYKAPLSDAEARSELARCAGTQFDPRVVEVLNGVLDSVEATRTDVTGTGCELLPHVRRHRDAMLSGEATPEPLSVGTSDDR